MEKAVLIYFEPIYSFCLGNSIGETGMKSLLLAVQYQTTLCALSPHPALKGLLKLSLQVSRYITTIITIYAPIH